MFSIDPHIHMISRVTDSHRMALSGCVTLSESAFRAGFDRKLLDLAAILDRIGRGAGAAQVEDDPRLEKVRRALEVLGEKGGGRAERIQQIFSLEYEAGWEIPQPRY
jgi:hypothetical protein